MISSVVISKTGDQNITAEEAIRFIEEICFRVEDRLEWAIDAKKETVEDLIGTIRNLFRDKTGKEDRPGEFWFYHPESESYWHGTIEELEKSDGCSSEVCPYIPGQTEEYVIKVWNDYLEKEKRSLPNQA